MFKHSLAFGFLSLFAVACGGQTTEAQSAADKTSPLYPAAAAASVNVLMTDKPPTLSSLSEVNVSLNKVQIHVLETGDANATVNPNAWMDSGAGDPNNPNALPPGAPGNANAIPPGFTDPNDTSIDDDTYWQTITLANSNFNLLALQGNVAAVIGGLDLAGGVLTQVRLFIDPNGPNNVVLADNTVCSLNVNDVINRGLRINQAFPHTPLQNGNTTSITIDFRIDSSLSQDGVCAFSLHPAFYLRRHEVSERQDGGWAAQHKPDSSAGGDLSGDANVSISASTSASIWNHSTAGASMNGSSISSGSLGGTGVRGSGTATTSASAGDSNTSSSANTNSSGHSRFAAPGTLLQ